MVEVKDKSLLLYSVHGEWKFEVNPLVTHSPISGIILIVKNIFASRLNTYHKSPQLLTHFQLTC